MLFFIFCRYLKMYALFFIGIVLKSGQLNNYNRYFLRGMINLNHAIWVAIKGRKQYSEIKRRVIIKLLTMNK